MKTKLGVNGVCGRMGQRIIQLAHEDKSLHLVAAVDFAGHPAQGSDAGEIAAVGKLGIPVAATIPLDVAPEEFNRSTMMPVFTVPTDPVSVRSARGA